MESSDLDQAVKTPRKSTRKRTARTADNDVSLKSGDSGRTVKKARLTPPTEADHQDAPPKPIFRTVNLDAISIEPTLSLEDVEKWPTYNPPKSGEPQPLFTTIRATWRNDELVGYETLGYYESMDEANHKVIASWDPAWDKNGGGTAHYTKEDGALWWQREESGGALIQVHARKET